MHDHSEISPKLYLKKESAQQIVLITFVLLALLNSSSLRSLAAPLAAVTKIHMPILPPHSVMLRLEYGTVMNAMIY